jgi:hypothetical protein
MPPDASERIAPPLLRRETGALRDFNLAYDRLGSNSTGLPKEADPFMSAMPPRATKTVSRSETSRCAKTGLVQCSKRILFDHLVGAADERQRDSETERLGGLEVDDQFDFRRLLDRQITRLLALQNSSDVDAD